MSLVMSTNTVFWQKIQVLLHAIGRVRQQKQHEQQDHHDKTNPQEEVLLVLVLVAEPSWTVSTTGACLTLVVAFFLCDLEPRQ